MRAALLLASIALSVVACKGKAEQKPAPGSGSAVAEVQIDWAKCDQALAQAATAPLDARPQIVLDGCQVCGGDWKALLDWNVDPASGGPKREQIEQRMVACKAFCTGDSKLKFIASVDKVRGQSVNTPWRQLATACKERVNGSSDDRFMSAPFFALDRIARAAAAHGSDKLAAIELPLPALTVSGTGVMLPDAEGVVPSVGPIQITVLGDTIHVGKLPRGKLTATGVTVDFSGHGYPGEEIKLEQLGAKLGELMGDDKTQPITILAPHAMSAQKLVPIIAALAPATTLHLAANAAESPTGWQLVGAIPIALEAGKDIQVTGEMTVQNLARELAVRVARKQSRVGVTKQ